VSPAFAKDALAIKSQLPELEFVIAFEKEDQAPDDLVAVASLVDKGRALYREQPGLYETLWREAKADDLATILYTSGSTGDPKGVMLTHRNLTANVLNSARWLELARRHELALTYLPFTHIFERAVWYLYAHIGATVAYAESVETVAKNLLEVRPTAMTSVPRMFEKI
jgi:long-chain acyl-CoA synthetase